MYASYPSRGQIVPSPVMVNVFFRFSSRLYASENCAINKLLPINVNRAIFSCYYFQLIYLFIYFSWHVCKVADS